MEFCFLESQILKLLVAGASSFTSGSFVVLIIAFARLDWLVSLQTVRSFLCNTSGCYLEALDAVRDIEYRLVGCAS